MVLKRALLLAAGFGRRLAPLTDTIPKCLVQVGEKPLLDIWLSKLEQAGFKEAIINTHYLHEQVLEFLGSRSSNNLEITLLHEPTLLGTARTLQLLPPDKIDEDLLVVHVDNYMEDSLQDLIQAHHERAPECHMTMLTFNTEHPQSCGIVQIRDDGVMTDFFEKSNNPPSTLANAAVYVFSRELLNRISLSSDKYFDISLDIIPLLKGQVQTVSTHNYFDDVGTLETLNNARSYASRQPK